MSAADLALTDAQRITQEIRDSICYAWRLIAAAYEGRVWIALDYRSWDDYLAGEFGAAPLRVPREERSEVVSSLRAAGLSTRAIASATGVDQSTVVRTPTPTGANAPVQPERITGLDGKERPATRPASPPRAPLPVTPAEVREIADATPPEPGPAELDAQLDERMQNTAARFVKNWTAAVARAGELRTFDLDRALEVCDRYGLELTARAWREWAADLEQRLSRSHLRVIGGRDE